MYLTVESNMLVERCVKRSTNNSHISFKHIPLCMCKIFRYSSVLYSR